jgi:hypothetical protein
LDVDSFPLIHYEKHHRNGVEINLSNLEDLLRKLRGFGDTGGAFPSASIEDHDSENEHSTAAA